MQKRDWEQLDWIINNLKDDPDPSIENAPDDPQGKFNVHLQTKNGESSRIIHTVRGRLCWLLMQMVAHPRIEEYERIFEIVERYATGENLYVRLHATVPLIELAKRRFVRVDANTRFMSDQLADRIKDLALRMVEENSEYPAVLEWVAHVMVCIRDLDHDTALKVIKKLLTIDQSEAANDVSWLAIYFALLRENHHFKQLRPFESEHIIRLLKDRLANGGGHFRATAANHFKTLIERHEIAFEAVVPYLESLLNGESYRVVSHHFYEIAAKHAAAYPDLVGRLIEKAVFGELKSLDMGGRELWHSRGFSKALNAVEQAGPEHKERIAWIRESIRPYKEKGRVYDIPDF